MMVELPKEQEFLELHLITVTEMEKRLDVINMEIYTQMSSIESLTDLKMCLVGAL